MIWTIAIYVLDAAIIGIGVVNLLFMIVKDRYVRQTYNTLFKRLDTHADWILDIERHIGQEIQPGPVDHEQLQLLIEETAAEAADELRGLIDQAHREDQ